MEYITLGKIVGVFGIKGEVKVYSCSHFSSTRYKKGNTIFIYDEKEKLYHQAHIKSYRTNKNIDIIAFEEYQDATAVEPFVNCLVQISKEKAPIPKDFYRYKDLENCLVFDETHNLIGNVKKVEEYASYQTLRISREVQKDILVPFVKAFILNVDIEAKEIIIKVWEGLL